MAKIIIHVETDAVKAKQELNNIEKQLTQLAKGIKISVDTSNLDGLSKQLLNVANNQAKAQIATANASKAQANAAANADKLAVAQEKTAQANAKASAEASKLAAAQEKTAQSANALASAQERTQQTANQAATAHERTAQSANAVAVAQEKTIQSANALATAEQRTEQAYLGVNTAQGNTVTAVNQVETAMQRQINALTGVSNETKSAADSARYFQESGLTAFEQTANAADRAAATAEKNRTAIEKLGNTIGNLSGQSTSSVSAVNQLVSGMDGMAGATVKATKSVDVGGQTWQQYSTQVKAAGGAIQTSTISVNTMTGEVKQLDTGLKNTNSSLAENIKKFTTWMVIGNAVSAVKRSFTEALDEMKKVDSELVTVRKVTDASAESLNKLSKRAYEVGSAYGKSASDYLSSVAEFSRAGYKDLAGDLGELSIKTQLVGDVNAETANQFLLSVDAAYKYNGSVTALTRVLDGANEIDNKYATSIQKIAEGLGKVAPIASQAHVSIGELSAAIGTITAVTQRSGTEASTALRALFLNIMGDTKTEIADGATWTAGEIEGLRDVIKRYAKDAYNAAEATGSVINPMEAIGGLAQSMKDGLLTEQQLMSMVSDIGGKLRSSQLLALIQNWDMYKNMLTDFGAAAGSADKEVGNALDSWEVKSERLKNSWAKMVSSFVDTKAIKGGLDIITTLVELLDTSVGKVIIFTAAITALSGTFKTFKGTDFFTKLATGFAGSWKIAAITAAIAGIIALVDVLNVTMDEAVAQADEAQQKYEDEKSKLSSINTELEEQKKLLDELKGKGEKRTEAENAQLWALEKQTEQLRIQAEIQAGIVAQSRKEAADAAANVINKLGSYNAEKVAHHKKSDAGWFLETGDYSTQILGASDNPNRQIALMGLLNKELDKAYNNKDSFAIQQYEGYIKDLTASMLENEKMLNTQVVALHDYVDTASEAEKGTQYYAEKVKALSEAEETQKRLMQSRDPEAYVRAYGEEAKAADEAAKAKQAEERKAAVQQKRLQEAEKGLSSYVKRGNEYGNAVNESTEKIRLLLTAQKEQNEQGKISDKTAAKLKAAYGDEQIALEDMTDGYYMTADAMDKLTDAEVEYLKQHGYLVDIESKDPFKETVSNVLSLTDELKGATDAIQAYKDKLAGGEKGDTFQQYADIYQKTMELYNKGMVGSNEYQAGAALLLGDDVMDSLGWDYEKAGQELGKKFYKSVFAEEGNDFAEKAATYMAKTVGDVYDENDNLIASFKKNGDTFSAVINDYDALAEKMGVSKDLLIYLSEAWGIYDASLQTSRADIEAVLSGMTTGVTTLANGMRQVNAEAFVTQLANMGMQKDKIMAIVKELQNMENVSLDTPIEDVGKLATKAVEAKTEADKLDEMTIKPEVDDTAAMTQLENLYAYLKDNIAKTFTATVEVIQKTTKSGGSLLSSGWNAFKNLFSFSNGTQNAPGGKALVNEKGAEIIAQDGEAYIANGGKPAIVELKPGAAVIPAEETKDALNGGFNGKINAYASGLFGWIGKGISNVWNSVKSTVNDVAKGVYKKKPSSDTNATFKNNYSSGGSRSSSSSSSSSEKEKDEDDYWNVVEDHVNYALEGIQLNLDDLQDKIEDIEKAEENALKPINDAIDAYEEQNDALDRQIELLERERDAATAPIDAEIEKLNEAKEIQDEQLQLEEKQKAVEEARLALRTAQNERTIRYFNQKTGQWEWKADEKEIKSAQETLEDANQALADFIEEMKVTALERQRDQLAKVYDDQITLAKKQQQIIDDNVYTLQQQAKAIEKEYDALKEPIQAQKDAMQEQYDAFQKQWTLIKHSVSAPTESISEALNKLASSGIPAFSNAVGAVTSLLKDLANQKYTGGSSSGGTNTGTWYDDLVNQGSGGSGTSGTGGSSGSTDIYTGNRAGTAAKITSGVTLREGMKSLDVGYLQQALHNAGMKLGSGMIDSNYGADTANAVRTYQRKYGLVVDGIAGPATIASLIAGNFDKGGIAIGRGLMAKDTNAPEITFPSDLSAKLLRPQRNAQFADAKERVSMMTDMMNGTTNNQYIRRDSSAIHDSHDNITYINGVKIGSDMMQKPLSEVLRVLSIYGD